MPSNSPSLWVIATPLGNLGDFSPRAQEMLAKADLVLAEDTRRTAQLLNSAGIKAKLISYHDANEEERVPELIAAMQEGKVLAQVSDAGTPLFSDPGFRLVRAARQAGLTVSAVPGPSAPLCALMASGIAPQPMTFLGFAPRKASEQKTLFATYGAVPSTLIFFERKNRLHDTLQVAFDVLGARELCVARELTKAHEEFILTTLGDFSAIPEDILGELTIIIGPAQKESVSNAQNGTLLNKSMDDEIRALLQHPALADKKPREQARLVAEKSRGWTVKEVYALLHNSPE